MAASTAPARRLGNAAGRALDTALGARSVVPSAVKVPLKITALFWVIKLVSTAMGESLADWLDGDKNLVIAGLGGLVALTAFVLALRLQFRTTRYVTGVYWFAVAMVATFGTMVADGLHQFLAAPYWASASFYAVILALVLWQWKRREGTLSIHSITNRTREKFYWGTVLATFALGTAVGDWSADNLSLHYLPSGIVFAVIIAIPAVAYLLGANDVAMFWFAYIVTRPLGASFADYLDSPVQRHGLGYPHIAVWGTLALVMIVLTSVLALSERRRAQADPARSQR